MSVLRITRSPGRSLGTVVLRASARRWGSEELAQNGVLRAAECLSFGAALGGPRV